MKRAYKLQEFVAHSSNVNCLKIGRKTSRVLVTGGEDHKVNMWAIGKPNAILSLSGHSSPVESVTFDAAESLVVAGAASGTIKLWDLEEAKIVRTLTGHRSNCMSVDFHPFGEFFASGSSDTNLKMWDIRRKGCIHTYKGHTRGVNCMKFSPDGRWIVSGGEDNIVKLWDLTAGKLIHDFKYHAGQILSLDFHPHEFLLTTGSEDRTAKFYDLETFELIGSSGPETTGVQSMVFTPDGRSLLCALQESLKVYSWEPLRCHDVIDASWSKLADMNVHEGKLLGCSFHQSCVGVWVVDLSRVAPFKSSNTSAPARDLKAPATGEHQKNSTLLPTKEASALSSAAIPRRNNFTRGDAVVSRTAECVRLSTPDPSSLRHIAGSGVAYNRVEESGPARSLIRLASLRKTSGELVKRNGEKETEHNDRLEAPTSASRNALVSDRTEQIQSELRGDRIATTLRDDNEMLMRKGAGRLRRSMFEVQGDAVVRGSLSGQALTDAEAGSHPRHMSSFGASTTGHLEVGRPRSSSVQWDRNERYNGVDTFPSRNGGKACSPNIDPFLLKVTRTSSHEPVNDMQVIEEIMQERTTMTSTMQSRLAKLQVVRRFWMKNDLKSAVETMAKMGDNSVLVDGLSVLIERNDVFTLEIAAMLLPLLNGLLSSDTQRHIMISMAFTSMLVRNFGHVIHETIAVCPSLGVDLQAERRLERCNACLNELQTFKQGLKPFLRKNGEVGKAAQDLNLTLQRVL